MRRHLLVTNDFPPKIGGIQAYLHELWRRLPADDVVVYTTPYRGAAEFDEAQPFRIIRSREPALVPQPGMTRRIRRLAAEVDAELVVLDPALPIGQIGPGLGLPYAVVVHGAEIAIPGRLPGSRDLLARVLRDAELVIAAGGYPAAEAEHAAGGELPVVVVPPGVDVDRFRPPDGAEQETVRKELGIGVDQPMLHTGSRLVPRKGIDTVLEAADRARRLVPDLEVVVTGTGRDQRRLAGIARALDVPVHFLGRVPDDLLTGVYGSADLFSMMCRVRWGGLEQEGFGIVFLEAAASGTPQIAGLSGGSHEAVVDGTTGLVIDPPTSAGAAARAIVDLLDDEARRQTMSVASRRHAEAFSYDNLVRRLEAAL